MEPLTVIMGPTASGKSALALRLARECGGEIVSADSMQLYRDLPVGTAQPTAAERAEIPHFLLGIWDLSRKSDVYTFMELADAAIADIRRRGKTPIVAGGTGLYLKALLYGLDPLPGDDALRRKLDAQYDSEAGHLLLKERMRTLDPAALEALGRNRRKLIRALEVHLLTGKSILELQKQQEPKLRFPVRAWRIEPEADELKKRIALRCRFMLDNGWIPEAEAAIAKGLFASPTAHQALGYSLIARYLEGGLTRAELEEKITTATWQFARRQRTWFRHQHPEARILTLEQAENGLLP